MSRRPLPAHSSVTVRSTARHRPQIVERQRQCRADGAADLERAVVCGEREVAADVVELGRRDVTLERGRWRFGVERGAVDHLQCGALLFEIVCQ